MQRIAVFGKGGIGKSTLSANLAATYARQGLRVLLVGCDPKHDTTVALTDGKPIATVVDQSVFMESRGSDLSKVVVRGRLGVDCVEAGGPEPGIGCAGRGISRMIDLLAEGGLLKEGRHDVAIFDVLGDVVCGGFAAPLRQGLADKVCIVVSEELMALYAANNIGRAVLNYAANGAGLCGLVANLRDPGVDRGSVERFAGLLGTRVLAFLPRDPAVREAEFKKVTAVEHAPQAPFSLRLETLAAELLGLDPKACPLPTPLSDEDYHALSREGFAGMPAAAAAPAPAPRPRERRRAEDDGDRGPRRDERLEEELSRIDESKGPDGGPNSRQWGGSEQWRSFFCDHEARRNARTGLESGGPVLMIRHQDLECDFATPNFEGDLVSFFNFPWPRRPARGGPPEGERRDGPPPGHEGEEKPPEGGRQGGGNMTTNLVDDDVIRGGGRRLREALETAVGSSAGLDAIIVQSTCVPTVIGDDAESFIDAFRQRTGVPILYANPADNREARVAQSLFDRVKAEGARAPAARRPDAVNLVGFPEGPGLVELVELLGRAGIAVNARGLPRLSLEQARRWLDAPAQVLYPNAAFESVYREVFRPLDIETLSPEAPYGVEGTRRWLEAVAARFERAAPAAEAFAASAEPLKPAWREGRELARGRRLGFVVDAAHVKRLSEPANLWGIPMVRVLAEMGFGIDVLIYGETKGALTGFKTPEELDARLKEGRFDAVYSEYFFDRRLTRAGKAQFSVPHFEPGLRGALRTLERLNGICAWPFYRRYGKYLGGGR